jgi:isoaspartyl peptidase/L-asparaginase-like protein (Ntn-hydrolase superfamily)
MPIFQRFEGEGGLIVIDQKGRIGIAHNTPYMPAAWITGDQAQIAAQVAQAVR